MNFELIPCGRVATFDMYGVGAMECVECGRVYAADDIPRTCSDDCPSNDPTGGAK